ncbi:RrF2 family transcriptional regulator [Christensenella tenuis]|jgi:Rrf2 family protein|uniref:Rrf2 family transcriptional regulator n=1 Tax=Christensenella tenuis TaxID=2763033 RepID=A0ABR7EKJ9_9FIRM|nr:Rrf2 family transcriptional regulator [Christensenella tenuis]MBC5649524.1 Rrf2 family transcriptional regulator [Christensenella tenuis]
MKISTRGRYGLRAMIDLITHAEGEYISLRSIAERQGISSGYLEGIFAALKKAGLVLGSAGSQGGYLPALPADEITIYRILDALESSLSLTEGSEPDAPPLRAFLNKEVWDRIDSTVAGLFDSITVADLIREFENRDRAVNSSGL